MSAEIAHRIVCEQSRPILSRSVVARKSMVSRSLQQQRRTGVVMQGLVQQVTGEELEVAIAGRDTPLVVDFFATWCGPCVLLAQELEKVAVTLGDKVRIIKVDVDANPELSSMLKIEGLPTMVFIPKDSGKPAQRVEGLMQASQIMEIIADL
ncbi:MAG: hypothetical protein WDW36_009526 [Sanguina aurantia]